MEPGMSHTPVPDFAGDLSVVIPVRDEADNVLPLLDEIDAALGGLAAYEVIFADDGSRDGTAARLAATVPAHPRLRVLRLQQSCGQSTALHMAVRAARHPWIATLDGDGQNDPADLPRLLEAVSAGRTTTSTPSGCLRSTAIDRRPRLSTSNR